MNYTDAVTGERLQDSPNASPNRGLYQPQTADHPSPSAPTSISSGFMLPSPQVAQSPAMRVQPGIGMESPALRIPGIGHTHADAARSPSGGFGQIADLVRQQGLSGPVSPPPMLFGAHLGGGMMMSSGTDSFASSSSAGGQGAPGGASSVGNVAGSPFGAPGAAVNPFGRQGSAGHHGATGSGFGATGSGFFRNGGPRTG